MTETQEFKELYFGNKQSENQYYTVVFEKKTKGTVGTIIISTPNPAIKGDRLNGLGYSWLPTLEVLEVLEESTHERRKTKNCVRQVLRCKVIDLDITF